MAATVEFREGDGISVRGNVGAPGASEIVLTAHVIGATDVSDAKAALAAYALPAGTAVINGVDVSACLEYLGSGEMRFVGFYDCDTRVYRGSVIYQNSQFSVPDL